MIFAYETYSMNILSKNISFFIEFPDSFTIVKHRTGWIAAPISILRSQENLNTRWRWSTYGHGANRRRRRRGRRSRNCIFICLNMGVGRRLCAYYNINVNTCVLVCFVAHLVFMKNVRTWYMIGPVLFAFRSQICERRAKSYHYKDETTLQRTTQLH